MPNHIVKQGEYLASIARDYGFTDWRVIWNHGSNSRLKALRKNPNVLFPGDQLFIPDRETKEENKPTTKQHKFLLKRPPLKLRLTLLSADQKPIKGLALGFDVEGDALRTVTDGAGLAERPITPQAKAGQLKLDDPQLVPERDWPVEFKIGHLDPLDEESGQKARLNNMGYEAGPLPPDPKIKPEDADLAFRSAVEEFQCDHGLAVDGKCGPNTQAKLKQAHGS